MPRTGKGPRLGEHRSRRGFYIYYTEDGRSRERSTGTEDREEAERIFAEFLLERHRRAGPRDPAEVLVTDVLNYYGEHHAPNVMAPERIGYALVPLSEYFAGRTVAEVPELCTGYPTWRGRSPGTARRELTVLRAAINDDVRKRRTLTHGVHVELPAPPPPKDSWLRREQAAKLLRASLRMSRSRLYLPLFIVIGLHTGRRKEQILSLRWPQVDLEAGTINWDVADRQETNKRRGKSRIPSKLLLHLARARKRGSETGYVVHRDGKRIRDIKGSFKNAANNAELDFDISPHIFRHTRATWGMQAGADKWKLAQFLGMSVETLERVYGHHHPDFQSDVADLVVRPQNVRRITGGF